MAFQPGQSGNPGGSTKRRLITNRLEIELLKAVDDGDKIKAQVIAEKVVDKAVAGDPWAIQFVVERTEGKPDQNFSVTRNVREITDADLANIATGGGEGIALAPDSAEIPSSVH